MAQVSSARTSTKIAAPANVMIQPISAISRESRPAGSSADCTPAQPQRSMAEAAPQTPSRRDRECRPLRECSAAPRARPVPTRDETTSGLSMAQPARNKAAGRLRPGPAARMRATIARFSWGGDHEFFGHELSRGVRRRRRSLDFRGGVVHGAVKALDAGERLGEPGCDARAELQGLAAALRPRLRRRAGDGLFSSGADRPSRRGQFWRSIVTAFFVWLGFVATTLTVNHRFGRNSWMLT